MKPLEQSSSDQNCDPESITEEEIALIDEHVLKNIHKHKSKCSDACDESHLERLIKNRNSEIYNDSNDKVQKEIKQKMENLQKQIESKHKRHQEVNMSKRKAALDLIKKKTEMDKIKTLQKFSSNIRYTDNDPALDPYFSETYQNCGLNLPQIGKQEEKEDEEEEVYEETFEAITEDEKDLNTSQTGKGQSNEENSHSSNLEKPEQTPEPKENRKISEVLTREEAKAPPKRKKSNRKKFSDEAIVERRNTAKVEGVRREAKLPLLPPVSPNHIPEIKARLIQTADDIRMPKIEKNGSLDRSQNNSSRQIFTPKTNKFAVKRPYEDGFQPPVISGLYKTINPNTNIPKNKTNFRKNNLTKKKYSFNLNEVQNTDKLLEVKGDNMFATFRRDPYKDQQMLEEIREDSGMSEDAIIECSNEQDDWKEPPNLRPIQKKTKAPAKNFRNQKRYKYSAKIAAPNKARMDVKTPVHKTRTAIHLSFGNNPGKTHKAYEQNAQHISPMKATSLKTVRGMKERRFIKNKIDKFSHLFEAGNYNTVRASKSRYSMENTTSVRPPTYKVSPRGSRVNSRDARAIFRSPRTPANFSVKKISVTRESSVEEVKQYDIKTNKGRMIRKMVRTGIRTNSKIRENKRLATSTSLKVTGIGGDRDKSREIANSPDRIENSYHRKVIKTVISKICLPRGKKCKTERKKLIELINSEENCYFAILFNRKKLLNSNNFKGVYKHICGTNLLKIYGDSNLPNKISAKMIEGFYKYDPIQGKLVHLQSQKRIDEKMLAFVLNHKRQTTIPKADDVYFKYLGSK